MTTGVETEPCTAWAPGLASSIPGRLMHLATIYRPEHALVSYQEASELAEFCHLKPDFFIAFRIERLVQHEILIRVTADLSVPDGPSYEELGINLRNMVSTLYNCDILQEMTDLETEFNALRQKAEDRLLHYLDQDLYGVSKAQNPTPVKQGFWARLFGANAAEASRPPKKPASSEQPELAALEAWKSYLEQDLEPLDEACLKALVRVVGGISGQRGRLVTDRGLTARIAVNVVSNDFGSQWVSDRISDLFINAAGLRRYRLLPRQEKPVVMNVKGASAAGKSTIRPRQRALAKKLDIPWEDFALISPDYWRKFLLDYDSLGEDAKYAAMLTGTELALIDKKLDRYMSAKALGGGMSHLLIDRFRFDSFTTEKNRGADSKLLTRFGDRIFMFFMITPPSETVERAWLRGKSTGRYKAVDDLLYHNIEAYTGMPELFFSWVLSAEKTVHFEFLNNDVPLGEMPRTVAFGWNGAMTILDIGKMIDIDRFKKVNIEARSPDDVFNGADLEAKDNLGFLKRCIRQLPHITFADQQSGAVYGKVENGRLVWSDQTQVQQGEWPGVGDNVRACVFEVLNEPGEGGDPARFALDIEREKQFTFGQWGPKA
ncbi:hypothetical protein [Coralliovum pocilloporae]|uniref:hypothetical protein n=1 Tax=Coralliovum pocilloporae TaxID=3066369 RepID=UPI003306D768